MLATCLHVEPERCVKMKPWTTLSRSVLLQPDGGQFLTVEEHVVQLPDGRIIDAWPWLATPSYINVVAETEDEVWQLMELHASVAHGEDPSAWTDEDRAYLKTLIKAE